MIAHHIAVEILGREFSPEGYLAHAVVLGGAFLFLFLSTVGLVTVCRTLTGRKRPEPSAPARA